VLVTALVVPLDDVGLAMAAALVVRGWASHRRYQRRLTGSGIVSIDAPETPAAGVDCPTSEASHVGSQPRRASTPSVGQGGHVSTILVVDDRPDARYSMARPLAAAGFDVRETATGRDALRLARSQIDAIVLDIALQDMDGFEVLQRLKDDPLTKNIPVILKTAAYRGDDHRERGLAAGAAAYFADSFDPQALVAVVRHVLGDGASSATQA
jgi:CheY-like chemotaxis protein